MSRYLSNYTSKSKVWRTSIKIESVTKFPSESECFWNFNLNRIFVEIKIKVDCRNFHQNRMRVKMLSKFPSKLDFGRNFTQNRIFCRNFTQNWMCRNFNQNRIFAEISINVEYLSKILSKFVEISIKVECLSLKIGFVSKYHEVEYFVEISIKIDFCRNFNQNRNFLKIHSLKIELVLKYPSKSNFLSRHSNLNVYRNFHQNQIFV